VGRVLDGPVEAVQRAQEAVAVEGQAHQRVDDLFHLDRDDVSASELRIVEDLADQPFGEQVLHQHFIDGGGADVRIERLPAEGEKRVEGGLEFLIGLVGVGDLLDQSLGQLRHALLKLLHSLLEVVDLRLGVGVKLVEQRDKLLGIGDVESVAFLAVLEQDGGPGVLKNRVIERVAFFDLLADFHIEIVVGVLCFPMAVAKIEGVAQGAIGEDILTLRTAHFELGNKRQVVGAAGFGQKLLEGSFSSAFVLDVLVTVCAECFVIALDRLVGRLEERGSGHERGNLGIRLGREAL